MTDSTGTKTDALTTRRDAARYLAVCEKTLANLSKPRGPIPVVRIGRAVRYDLRDLRAFIDRQKAGKGGEAQR